MLGHVRCVRGPGTISASRRFIDACKPEMLCNTLCSPCGAPVPIRSSLVLASAERMAMSDVSLDSSASRTASTQGRSRA